MQTIQLRSSLSPDSEDGAAPQAEAWIDIEAVDEEGRRWLASQSGLDDEIIRRLLDPAPATYWRRFGQGHYFNMHTAVPGVDTLKIAIVDFGIWLEPGRIISVRRSEVPALDKTAEACAAGVGPSNSWELIVFLLSEGMSRLEQSLHELTATVDRLEDEALARADDPPIHRLADLQKRLIFARRFRVAVANMVSFISSQPGSVTDGPLGDELEGIVNALAQHQELLSLSIDRASALQSQIRDQLADSMNAATYRFTWVATVFLPLSFLTGLLGINVAGIPGDHNPLAFWLVCGVLCVIAAAWGIAVGRVTRPFRRRSGTRDR
jgi:zinc transporter